MKLSSRARYGVRALFDIAFHGDGCAAQIKDIAERQGVPPRFLEQIFQDLRRAGLVSSKRGPRGGYQLTRSPADISVGHILTALEGGLGIQAGEDETAESGDPASIAITDGAFRDIAREVQACFDRVSLEALCQQATESGLRKNSATGYVYVI